MRRPAAILLLATATAALAAQQDAEVSCRTCHPGAQKGLERSLHAVLTQRQELQGKVCSSCHGDLSAHARAIGHELPIRPAVPAVTAASCASCHADQSYEPARGHHLLLVIGSGQPPPPPPEAERIDELQQQERDPAIDWSGFAELGYRFVHHEGSRAAYRTDLDLEPTLLLRAFEVRGRGGPAAAFDDLALRGTAIGDPRWDVDLGVAKTDRFDVDSRFRRARYGYDATGDYHRVDRDNRSSTTTVAIGDADLQVFGDFRSLEADGFWLTQRIGNRNLPVQTVVDGVDSPRRLRSHDGELGVRFGLGSLRIVIAGGFADQRSVDRWSYSQPATANPGFTESEDLTTESHLDGPTGRLVVSHDAGPVSIELSGAARELQRRVASNGIGEGYDTGAFTDRTTAIGRGRLLRLELDLGLELSDTLRLALGAHHRDYREHLRLDQVESRTRPSPSPAVTVASAVDDETVQRLFDGELRLEWHPTADFDAAIGYGIAREQLRVSSPGPADPQDFRRGHLDDDGLLADLRWRFAAAWTVRVEGRDFASDGVRLDELTPARARQAATSLEWRQQATEITAFARHRHNDNDVSGHRLDTFATGASGTVTADALSLSAGYTFADIESRTRTNFYFDPDPDPRPTIVGFRGETHTWHCAVGLDPAEPFDAELGAALTRTSGDFAVETLDVYAGLRWRCCERGAAGLEWRRLHYRDRDGRDDWAADLVFVYWRQEW